MTSITENDLKRFWNKVDRRSDDECWEWKAGKNPAGYGLFCFNGRKINANRFALMTTGVELTDDVFACHHCDNPSCVNPNHLFLGTQSDNLYDMVAKGRHFAHATPERVLRGEDHGMAQLTWRQVGEIRSQVSLKTRQELSAEYGVSVQMIYLIISNKFWIDPDYTPPKRKQVEGIGDRQRAEDNPSAKLTWEIVRKIRELGASHTCDALAEMFKTHPENVRYIIKNKTWVDPSYKPPVAPVKLSLEIANQVRELHSTGEYSTPKLAEKFGIGKSTVWKILTNKIYTA